MFLTFFQDYVSLLILDLIEFHDFIMFFIVWLLTFNLHLLYNVIKQETCFSRHTNKILLFISCIIIYLVSDLNIMMFSFFLLSEDFIKKAKLFIKKYIYYFLIIGLIFNLLRIYYFYPNAPYWIYLMVILFALIVLRSIYNRNNPIDLKEQEEQYRQIDLLIEKYHILDPKFEELKQKYDKLIPKIMFVSFLGCLCVKENYFFFTILIMIFIWSLFNFYYFIKVIFYSIFIIPGREAAASGVIEKFSIKKFFLNSKKIYYTHGKIMVGSITTLGLGGTAFINSTYGIAIPGQNYAFGKITELYCGSGSVIHPKSSWDFHGLTLQNYVDNKGFDSLGLKSSLVLDEANKQFIFDRYNRITNTIDNENYFTHIKDLPKEFVYDIHGKKYTHKQIIDLIK